MKSTNPSRSRRSAEHSSIQDLSFTRNFLFPATSFPHLRSGYRLFQPLSFQIPAIHFKDYWPHRKSLIALLQYLSRFQHSLLGWDQDAKAAAILAGALENEH
jgi:hypothetical protein